MLYTWRDGLMVLDKPTCVRRIVMRPRDGSWYSRYLNRDPKRQNNRKRTLRDWRP